MARCGDDAQDGRADDFARACRLPALDALTCATGQNQRSEATEGTESAIGMATRMRACLPLSLFSCLLPVTERRLRLHL